MSSPLLPLFHLTGFEFKSRDLQDAFRQDTAERRLTDSLNIETIFMKIVCFPLTIS